MKNKIDHLRVLTRGIRGVHLKRAKGWWSNAQGVLVFRNRRAHRKTSVVVLFALSFLRDLLRADKKRTEDRGNASKRKRECVRRGVCVCARVLVCVVCYRSRPDRKERRSLSKQRTFALFYLHRMTTPQRGSMKLSAVPRCPNTVVGFGMPAQSDL